MQKLIKMKIFRSILVIATAIALASCCACRKSNSAKVPLMQTKWTVVQLDGQTVKTDDNFYIILTGEDGRFNGRGDCNSMFGTYTVGADGAIDFAGVASTRAFCPNQQLEDTFFRTLEAVTSYTIDGKMLMLFRDGDVAAVLETK